MQNAKSRILEIKTNIMKRAGKMRRGSGKNIRKSVNGGVKEDDKNIEARTEESFSAEDTRS